MYSGCKFVSRCSFREACPLLNVCNSLGPSALATQSILVVTESTVWLASYALSMTSSVRFVPSCTSILFYCSPETLLEVLVTSSGNGTHDVLVSQHIHRLSWLWRYQPCGGAMPTSNSCTIRSRSSLPSTLLLVFKRPLAKLFTDDAGKLSAS
jgi:hypothetical protein